MFLRTKDGFYKGEIREFPFDVGRTLLKSGRAEDPYAEPERVQAAVAAEPAHKAAPKRTKAGRA